MNTREIRIFIAFCLLLVAIPKTYCAFPIQREVKTSEVVDRQTDVDFKKLINTTIEKFTQNATPQPPEQSAKGKGLGIGAFAAGIIGLAALITGFAIVSPVLVGIAIAAGVAAIALGGMGLKRGKGGFALAGLILGIVNLSALLILVLLALLALSYFDL